MKLGIISNTKHYGRYTSKASYEHAKALRRINARKWRRRNKAKQNRAWFLSDTKYYILHRATLSEIAQFTKMVHDRGQQLSRAKK